MRKTILTAILASAIAIPALVPAAAALEQGSAMPQVVSPPVPRELTFAGHKFNFERPDMYERIDRELTSMTYSHGSTLLMLKRANRYFPMMREVLRKAGVPEDMVYLAAIESTLDPRAYSGAKAAGLWQFLPATARQYGLEVTDYVDERYHPEKSTAAAAKFLKSAYAKYGNWESAMASYNGGQGRISKELASQLADSAFDLYLVEETSRYMFRVLAAKVLMENPAKFGYKLRPSQLYAPYEYTEVTVTSTIDDLPAWAKARGTNYARLREYNPWLRAKSLPVAAGKSYTIKLPGKQSIQDKTK